MLQRPQATSERNLRTRNVRRVNGKVLKGRTINTRNDIRKNAMRGAESITRKTRTKFIFLVQKRNLRKRNVRRGNEQVLKGGGNAPIDPMINKNTKTTKRRGWKIRNDIDRATEKRFVNIVNDTSRPTERS